MIIDDHNYDDYDDNDDEDDDDDDGDDDDDDEGNLVVLLSVKTSLVLSRQFDNSEIVWRPTW